MTYGHRIPYGYFCSGHIAALHVGSMLFGQIRDVDSS